MPDPGPGPERGRCVMSEWRDISTAPQDRPVLIWDALTRHCRVAQLCTSIEEGDSAWVYARRFSWDAEPALAFIAREPTHWIPLPEPPSDRMLVEAQRGEVT